MFIITHHWTGNSRWTSTGTTDSTACHCDAVHWLTESTAVGQHSFHTYVCHDNLAHHCWLLISWREVIRDRMTLVTGQIQSARCRRQGIALRGSCLGKPRGHVGNSLHGLRRGAPWRASVTKPENTVRRRCNRRRTIFIKALVRINIIHKHRD